MGVGARGIAIGFGILLLAGRDLGAADSVPAPEPPLSPAPTLLPRSLPPLQTHAFVSQGAIKSTKNNFLTPKSKRGTLEFTEVGINFTQPLTEQLRVGIQLFARELGDVGDYRARVDWFYLDYAFEDWLGLRVGRTKLRFGLYNEVNDTDAARVPVLLPQSVYPILNRDLLLAQTGVEVYGYLGLGGAGDLEYCLYGGTLYADAPERPPLVLEKFDVPYLAGARLFWETPLQGLRIGGSAQTLRFDTTYTFPGPPGMPPGRLELGLPFRLWLASMEYLAGDLLIAAEYGRWKADVESNIGPTTTVENERYYSMVSYRIRPWVTPGFYYSKLIPNVDKREGRENYRYDFAATLRFDVNANWLLKLEGHFMRGTAELEPGNNDGQMPAMLPRDWLLFLAKTTVYF